MAESPTQPILVRDDTAVPTVVGVSDPSLTLVEFVDGIGFFSAENFQHDRATRLDALENVSVRKYAGHAWGASEHERIVLAWNTDHPDAKELLLGELGVAPARWTPAVFFLTAEEFLTHRASLKARQPEQVLRAVFARGAAVPALQAGQLRLWTRHREALERLFVPSPRGRVQPRKETVRISLPPKPAAVLPASTPGKAKPPAGKLAALKKWFRNMFRKGTRPRQAASLDEIQNMLNKLTPEERAELERFLRRFKPLEIPPPQS